MRLQHVEHARDLLDREVRALGRRHLLDDRGEAVVRGLRGRDRALAAAQTFFPFSKLKGQANVLIFPSLEAANVSYKLLSSLAGARAIGPILMGMDRPVALLQKGADVQDIVTMAAIAVVDSQEESGASAERAAGMDQGRGK